MKKTHKAPENGTAVPEGNFSGRSEPENYKNAYLELKNKYDNLFKSNPDAIVISDISEGKLLEVNDSFLRLTGYSQEELVGKTAKSLGVWGDEEGCQMMTDGIRKNGVYANLETEIKTSGGENIPVLITSKKYGENGSTQLISYIRDFRRWKEVHGRIQEEEERLKTLINTIPDVIVFKDGEGKWVEVNKSGLDLFELKEIDYVGKTDEDLAEILPSLKESLLNVKHSDEKVWEERRLIRRDEVISKDNGKKRIFDVIKAPVFSEDDSRKSLIVVGRDITEKKSYEEALKKSEEEFRSLFENAAVGMYRSSYNGKMLMTNPVFVKMLGYDSAEEICNINLADIYLIRDDRSKFLSAAESKNKITGFETRLVRKDGTLIEARINARVFRDENGKIQYFEGMVEDITEKKKAEELVLKAREEAEKSDVLKSEFLAQMSHEIRTPINSLLNSAFLIKEELSRLMNEDLKSCFNIIDNSGIRIIRTIDSILNMSEIQTGTYDYIPKTIDIYNDVILQVYEEFKFNARNKKLDFSVNNVLKKTLVDGDEYSIRQIFVNLIDNALKFTDEGRVEINMFKMEGGRIVVEVRDSGIGISPNYMPNLFKPFTQEEQGYTRKYEGNGLGLALVKKYCELNKAEISVESQKGSGSAFTVSFPSK